MKSVQLINGRIEKKIVCNCEEIISVPSKWNMPLLVNKTNSVNFIFLISIKSIKVEKPKSKS